MRGSKKLQHYKQILLHFKGFSMLEKVSTGAHTKTKPTTGIVLSKGAMTYGTAPHRSALCHLQPVFGSHCRDLQSRERWAPCRAWGAGPKQPAVRRAVSVIFCYPLAPGAPSSSKLFLLRSRHQSPREAPAPISTGAKPGSCHHGLNVSQQACGEPTAFPFLENRG